MEEVVNITMEEVQELIKNFPIKPRHSRTIITLNIEEPDPLDVSDNMIDECQYILAKGDMVRDIELGDKVIIDLKRMMVKTPNPNNQYEDFMQVEIDMVEVDGKIFGYLEDRFIKAIDNRID